MKLTRAQKVRLGAFVISASALFLGLGLILAGLKIWERRDVYTTRFTESVSGLDIEHKKPAPDIFLKAAEKLGVHASDCLVIEDAVSGVVAGKAAGSRVLALTTSFSPDELSAADWIAASLPLAGEEIFNW